MMNLNSFLFITIGWLDVLDIVLVAILLYQLYKLIKGTVAIRIFLGILAIYLLWKVVSAVQMELLSEILGQFIGVGVLALIIVFQQEIRHFLILLGSQSALGGGVFKRLMSWSKSEDENDELDINAIVKACFNMSRTKTGALIVLTLESELKFHASTGDAIDAKLSANLLETIFFTNSPLHDGAVIIHLNRIVAARCILPVSDKDLPSQYGLRHRAALGITENTNAIAIVVSEETGEIATAKDSKLTFDLSTEDLKNFLNSELLI